MKPTSAPSSSPNLLTVIQRVIADAFNSVHTAFPAQIEKYDYKTAKAYVKPLLSATYPDGSIMELPVIPNVPVIWPRTSLGSISFPLQRGDGCLVVCSEKSMDDWLTLGGINAPTDPRSFDLNDAIAIPGLYSFASQTKIKSSDKFEIHYKDQEITIDTSGKITLGGTGLQKLMTKAAMDAFNSHVHLVTIAALNTPTPSATPTTPMIEATHLTSKVEAQ